MQQAQQCIYISAAVQNSPLWALSSAPQHGPMLMYVRKARGQPPRDGLFGEILLWEQYKFYSASVLWKHIDHWREKDPLEDLVPFLIYPSSVNACIIEMRTAACCHWCARRIWLCKAGDVISQKKYWSIAVALTWNMLPSTIPLQTLFCNSNFNSWGMC